MTQARIDPVALGILWRRMAGLMDEVAETFIRTSFSTVVRENGDMAMALLDSRGQQFVQSTRSVPSFIGTLPRTLAAMWRRFPPETLKPGDVMITNDPWLGSGHLNDITMLRPLFRKGRVIGYIGSVFHTVDIGGAPSPHARDRFEEGLCIPVAKAMVEGRENPFLIDLLMDNLREPAETIGDLRAQFAAYEATVQRLDQLMQEEGIDDLDSLSGPILDRSEQAMRRSIEQVPDGDYIDELTADGFEEPLTIRASIAVRGSQVHVDYAGTSAQIGKAVNSVMNFTYAYTVYALKCVLDPETPNNSGAFRPFSVDAPAGTIVNAVSPAPVWARHLTGHYLPFVVFGALASVLPERVTADSGAPGWSVYFRGIDPESRRRFVRMYFMTGGYGARHGSDGPSCLAFPTNVSNTPVEAFEAITPLLITRKELIEGSGGDGRWRGGLGQRIAFRSESPDPLVMTIRHERVEHPPRGLLGGLDGRPGRDFLNGVRIPAKTIQSLQLGDEVCFETPGGGGLGRTELREASAREADRRLGLLGDQANAG
jgi:N-methylhydantoinase B